MPKKRGAVIIGVNKTGGLTPLESPVTGAEAFATWLRSEGFDVKIITDKGGGRVSYQQIQEAITAFVKPGTYHQLVIYFSGHGYWKNDTELWLLSDAPADANAAVSWVETAEFAKDCGIPNVVMISDACRSIPNTTQQMKVRGSIVFPNDEVQRSRAKVDKFMAAATGRPAYEIPIAADGTKGSTFTYCFLKAFKYPDLDMISKVTEDGEEIEVVPNRRLEKYLRREVSDLLARVNVQLDQTPDAEVLSDDDVYLGRAHLSAVAAERRPPVFGPPPIIPPVVSLKDVAAVAIDHAMDVSIQLPPRKLEAIRELARTSGFDSSLSEAQRTAPVTRFETETGFAVLGASVAEVATTNGGQAFIVAPGDRNDPGVIRVGLAASACAVVLRFASGRGTALAALQGYICHVLVDGNSVTNVSYVP
jgi:Caspase domain